MGVIIFPSAESEYGGGLTLSQARDALQARGYGQDTKAAQTQTITTAVREVWSMRRWDFRLGIGEITLTVGEEIAPSSLVGVDSVDAVRLTLATEYYDLEWLPYQEISEQLHLERETGVPRYWNYTNGVLYVAPAPDQAYVATVYYVKQLPLLSDDNLLPGPPDFHDVYVYAAIRDIAARERDAAMVQWADSMFQRRLGQLATQHGFKQRHSGRTMRKSGFFDDSEAQSQWLS